MMVTRITTLSCLVIFLQLLFGSTAGAVEKDFRSFIFNPGTLKPVDSVLKVNPGDLAPDFTLPSIMGDTFTLSQLRGRKNVVISFVPAAWTPVCSDQWPGYAISKELFADHDALLIGISVDNIPTLYAWTRQMGDIWFPVLSDFWPHGQTAERYGLLRGDGTAERALVFINKEGVISNIIVSDINVRPPLERLVAELVKMQTTTP